MAYITSSLVLLSLWHGQIVATSCESGYVLCDDGQCLPQDYSNLCQISGGGTVKPLKTGYNISIVEVLKQDDAHCSMISLQKAPTGAFCNAIMLQSVTTCSSTPNINTTTIGASTQTQPYVTTAMSTSRISTTAKMRTQTGMMSTSTRVPVATQTPPTDASTVKSSPSIVNTCHVGYTLCNDGKCEPYPSLCGATGYVTTKAPPTKSTVKMTSSGIQTAGPSAMVSGVTSGSSTMAATTIQTVTTTAIPIVTDATGQEVCPSGWEKCKDGVCEPFHWLCTEHDGTVTTTPVPYTSPTTMSPSSSAATVGTSGSTSVPGVSSMLLGSTTQSVNGDCPNGWEKCADGVCEPFHWLCTEHDGSNVTIPTPGTVPTLAPGQTTTAGSTVVSTTVTTTTQATTTTTVGKPIIVSTDASGSCHTGWTQCKDGKCEPYQYLCDDVLVG